ncbi:MAG: TRAP transporter large permease [Deferrisomatales bacterium]|nr:TRAP transporter large permease [Deferrisomatales bacterium]
MSPEIASILVFVGLLFLLCMGYPIAFSMGAAVALGIISLGEPFLFTQLSQITKDVSTNFLFLVAPLFILMSEFILVSGIARDAFQAASLWLSWLPGGLAVSSIFACSAFAAVCGSSPVTAATIGMVAIPGMTERGYQRKLAAGVVCAAGSIGIMIPPSLCMIIYAVMTGTSIGKLFIAGIVPGIVLTIVLSITVIIKSIINPSIAPAVKDTVTWKQRLDVSKKIGPILILSFLVMGSIYGGFATPTEAAAVGATGAFIVMLFKIRFSFDKFTLVLRRSASLTSSIMMLLVGGTTLAFFMSYSGIPQQLVEFTMSLGLNRWLILIVINIVSLVLGCFLDPSGILVLMVPLVFPIIESLGFDPVWFGIILTLNVEIGMITPPVGLNLYVLNAVDRSLQVSEIIAGTIPFLFSLILCLVLLTIFPQLVLWLPGLVYN